MASISNIFIPAVLIGYIETFLNVNDQGLRLSSKAIYKILKEDPNYQEKAAHQKALRILSSEGTQVQLKQRRLSICMRNPSEISKLTAQEDILAHTYSLGVISGGTEDITKLCATLSKKHKKLEKLVLSHVSLNKESYNSLKELTHSSQSQVTLHQVTGYTEDKSPQIAQTKETLAISDCLGIEMHLPTILSFFNKLEKDEAEALLVSFNALSEAERNGIIHEVWRIVAWNTHHEKDKDYPVQFLLENLKEPSVQAAVWSYIETLKNKELLQ